MKKDKFLNINENDLSKYLKLQDKLAQFEIELGQSEIYNNIDGIN